MIVLKRPMNIYARGNIVNSRVQDAGFGAVVGERRCNQSLRALARATRFNFGDPK
jgi:hypothetical protein